jgi:hypothetical protein
VSETAHIQSRVLRDFERAYSFLSNLYPQAHGSQKTEHNNLARDGYSRGFILAEWSRMLVSLQRSQNTPHYQPICGSIQYGSDQKERPSHPIRDIWQENFRCWSWHGEEDKFVNLGWWLENGILNSQNYEISNGHYRSPLEKLYNSQWSSRSFL